MTLARSVHPEILDELAPSDPAARRSRRDLVRVHLAMGTRGIAARAWRSLLPDPDGERPARVLELGAGDGTLALAVARRLAPAWPDVHLTLLDRQDVVADETRGAFAALGWRCAVKVVDVLDWASDPDPDADPDPDGDPKSESRPRSKSEPGLGLGPRSGPRSQPRTQARPWDLIVTSLFLHHFEGATLAHLIAAVAARTRAFHAFEPRRDRLALAGSRLIGALGTNAVTRSDAVTSVHAGFRDEELSALWPASDTPTDPVHGWTLAEGRAGPFGHGFAARRGEAVRS